MCLDRLVETKVSVAILEEMDYLNPFQSNSSPFFGTEIGLFFLMEDIY